MDVVEHELKRYDQMKLDLDKRKHPENFSKEIIDSREELNGILMNVEKPKEVNLHINNYLVKYSQTNLNF